MFDLNRISN